MYILSIEACEDKTYGETIVQYKAGDIVSFAFSPMSPEQLLANPAAFICSLQAQGNNVESKPLWSNLSPKLLSTILENPFDMHFVEYGSEGWSKDLEDKLFAEIYEQGLLGAVTCGEDSAHMTVYAGAMGSINWFGHPVYGNACFEIQKEFQQEQALPLIGIKKKAVLFSSLLPAPIGPALDQHLKKHGWELQAWDTGAAQGYQLFFGAGVQVDNYFEYGFPYLYDDEELMAFAKKFYECRVCNNLLVLVDEYKIDDLTAVYTVSLEPGFMVDVKVCSESGLVYVMQNDDGSTVYRDFNNEITAPNYKYDIQAVENFVREAHAIKNTLTKPLLFEQIQSAAVRSAAPRSIDQSTTKETDLDR